MQKAFIFDKMQINLAETAERKREKTGVFSFCAKEARVQQKSGLSLLQERKAAAIWDDE